MAISIEAVSRILSIWSKKEGGVFRKQLMLFSKTTQELNEYVYANFALMWGNGLI